MSNYFDQYPNLPDVITIPYFKDNACNGQLHIDPSTSSEQSPNRPKASRTIRSCCEKHPLILLRSSDRSVVCDTRTRPLILQSPLPKYANLDRSVIIETLPNSKFPVYIQDHNQKVLGSIKPSKSSKKHKVVTDNKIYKLVLKDDKWLLE